MSERAFSGSGLTPGFARVPLRDRLAMQQIPPTGTGDTARQPTEHLVGA
jgi:hypothetical protein